MGVASHWRLRRQCSRILDPPNKCVKRSGSLDLFTYLLGRALAVDATSGTHSATTSTGCAHAVRGTKDGGWSGSSLWSHEAQERIPQSSATAACLPNIIGVADFAWRGSIPRPDDAALAASTRKNQLRHEFTLHERPARGNVSMQCERHTETAVRQFMEQCRFPASGSLRFAPCAGCRPLPQQRVEEQRNAGACGRTGTLRDMTTVAASRFAAASEEIACCKLGHAPAAGSK